jgi:catechol 2,3-dioxygenase-like lactoylglutathione lyase family enzyme
MELEPIDKPFVPATDRRPRIPEPPPVRLLTVDDAHLPGPAGIEVELDAFYVTLLGFERDATGEFPVYRAENFRVLFDILEPPIARGDFRPLRIEVPSVNAAEQKLMDAGIEYTRQRGLLAGQESLALLDPAGNWVEINEGRPVR